MRIRIVESKTNKIWLYNFLWEDVKKELSSYELIHMLDETLLNIVAIEMVVKKIYGFGSKFLRDTSIHDYICGKIIKEKEVQKDVLIFFEL